MRNKNSADGVLDVMIEVFEANASREGRCNNTPASEKLRSKRDHEVLCSTADHRLGWRLAHRSLRWV